MGINRIPIFDNHLHLRRTGRFLDAVKDFKKAGGTHFVLCQLPNVNAVIKEKSYRSIYQETLKMAKEIHSSVAVGIFVTVGPYPVDYLKLTKKFGREMAIQIMKNGMDLAADLCEDKKCIAIGEIGRPHFPVNEKVLEDSNEILQYGMERAKDVEAPVVIHAESTTPEQCQELMLMGKKVGLPADKIVKHYSPPLIKKDENHGLMPSILASKKNVLEALRKGTRFLMETDYIDDLNRPGAVLGPKTVPKTTINLMQNGVLTEKQAYQIHKEIPEKTYDIELDFPT